VAIQQSPAESARQPRSWPASARSAAILEAVGPFLETIQHPILSQVVTDPGTCNFLAGNPQELASKEYVDVLQRWAVPADKNWFGYKGPDETAKRAAAEGLSAELDMAFDPADVVLTRGASGALAAALAAVVDVGDEVIFVSPPWFFYEADILGAGAVPVRVRMDEDSFDLDLGAIEAAIGPRTRAVIVNTPHNPTGRIYPEATLRGLADRLSAASQRNGRPVYIISDEAYSRILFSGARFDTPGRYYPRTFLIHTYSKTALAPGQRIGFLAMPESMPDREDLRAAFMASAFTLGGLPDALMQYALPDIEQMCIDVGDLEAKRDRMARELRTMGYRLHVPEATFYLLPRCPVADDLQFSLLLAERGVAVLPGRALEMPGFFRISLTATHDMIDRALPVFADAI
jgi:aspartate aminotransferase